MVRDPTLYCCLTIVRIDFKLGVSKEGPIEQEAQALWHPIMLDWRRSTKAQASSFSWGTLEGNPKAVAILTAHWAIEGSLGRYGRRDTDQKPDICFAAIADTLSPLCAYLECPPRLINIVTERPEIVDLARKTHPTIDLFMASIRMDHKDCTVEDEWLNSPLDRLQPVKHCKGLQVFGRQGCVYHKPVGDLREIWIGYQLQSYLTVPRVDEVIEQVLMLEWNRIESSEKTKRGDKWRQNFDDAFGRLQKEGKVPALEHWSIEIQRWPTWEWWKLRAPTA